METEQPTTTKRKFENISDYPVDSAWDFPAPRISVVSQSIYEKGVQKPVAKLTLAEVVAEENRKLFGPKPPQLALWANPFPEVPNMPLYSWETISVYGQEEETKELKWFWNKGLGYNTAYLCDRLYHLTPHGFQFPILASPAPPRTDKIGCQLVVCPCSSDDFHLYSRVMGFLWDAVQEIGNPRWWKFNRTYVDWRTFHEKRDLIAAKLMWYLDSRTTALEFWREMLPFVVAKPWDDPQSFPGLFAASDSLYSDRGLVELVYDAVYWPVLPPPVTNQYYDRIRFLPVTWSDI